MLGVGIGGQGYTFNNIGLYNYPAAHNMIISSLAEMGLLGFIPFIYLIIVSFKNIKITTNKNSDLSLIYYLFISLLLLGIGETIFTERILWIIMMFCISSKKFVKKDFEIYKNRSNI